MPISQKTLKFLTENRFLDNRDWFKAHKAAYQQLVLQPLAELVENLAPTIKAIDPLLITEARVDRTISRIYRDTRFSKDKFLYRDVMWIVFMRDKKLFHGPPGFFMEFSPRGFRYGCGFYQATSAAMQVARTMMVQKHKAFVKAMNAYTGQCTFALEGESYKRSKYPNQPEEFQAWLNRKNLAFIHNSDNFDLLFSNGFYKTIASGFKLLQPVYEFLAFAHERAEPHKKVN